MEYGDTIDLTGRVLLADGSTPSGTATLQVSTPLESTWRAVATDPTPGSLDFPGVRPARDSAYRVVFAGSSGQAPSTSGTVVVRVSRRVADRVRHRRLVVVGTVQPAYAHRRVVAEVRHNGAWRFLARVATDDTSTFRIRLYAVRQRTHFRVIVPASDGFSRWVGHYATLRY